MSDYYDALALLAAVAAGLSAVVAVAGVSMALRVRSLRRAAR